MEWHVINAQFELKELGCWGLLAACPGVRFKLGRSVRRALVPSTAGGRKAEEVTALKRRFLDQAPRLPARPGVSRAAMVSVIAPDFSC